MSDLAVCDGKLICQMTGDDLRSEVKRLRCELVVITAERDLLRRQVERLGTAAASLADMLSSCFDCPCGGYCIRTKDADCKAEILKWSLEQAKKGGGGE